MLTRIRVRRQMVTNLRRASQVGVPQKKLVLFSSGSLLVRVTSSNPTKLPTICDFTAFWAGSLALLIQDWRSGRLHNYHREQPFQPPIRTHDEEEPEAEDDYEHIPPARRTTTRPAPSSRDAYETSPTRYDQPQRYGGPSQTPLSYTPAAAGRPSMDAYGAFSDPAPSGFGSSGYGTSNANAGYAPPSSRMGRTVSPPPTIPDPDFGQPMLSRTMQYADPYAAVRASIATGAPQQQGTPPSYESYPGYR